MRIVRASTGLTLVTCAILFFQWNENSQLFEIAEGAVVIIKPGIHHIDAVHQSFRERTEIGLTETELGGIDTSHQRFLIQALCHDALQLFPDHPDETVFILRIGIFCRDAEYRLHRAAVIGTADILSEACVEKRLFQGSPGAERRTYSMTA